jgi:hypothetical protein
VIKHLQELTACHRTTPTTLNLSDKLTTAPVVPPTFDTTSPTLELRDGPENAWSCPTHMLLESWVETFKQQKHIHCIHEEVKLPVALGMNKGKAFRAQQLLALLAIHSRTCLIALIAARVYCDLRHSVVSAMSIEVALPKARNTEIILAVVAMKCSSAILAFLTLLLRLDDLSI